MVLAAGSSAAQKSSLLNGATNHLSKPPLVISVSYRVSSYSQDFLHVTVGARNDGTTPVSFHISLPCESEIKLYHDETHAGTPLHFVGEGGVGHVEVTLGPGESHAEDCGVFALSALVQGNGHPALPGVYYLVFDMSQSGAADFIQTEPKNSMIAVGSYSENTANVGPFFSLTGTSRVVGSGIQIILTIMNNGAEGVMYKKPKQEDCQHRIALYQDEAHSGTPFRYVHKDVPFGDGPVHWAGRDMLPLQESEAYTTTCGEEPIPIDHLMRGTEHIPPGTYYVVYLGGPDEDPQGILLNLGRIVIP